AFANPPGCGREHFAAVAEVYRLLLNRQERASTVTDARAALGLDAAPIKPTRKPQTVRARPPDGLLTPAEAAAKPGCSEKTLNGHVATGALGYVDMGHGRKRMRRMFADADLDQFIANQSRKVTPCPSTAGRARPTGTSTFTGEVVDFTGPRKPRTSA